MIRPLVILIVLGFAAPIRAAELDLNPAKTYVVVAGVLEWRAKKIYEPFPKKHRKDRELFNTFRGLGVPAANMKMVLDREATLDGIKSAVADVAGRAPADATLIVYYAGHGGPTDDGSDVSLANFDATARRTLTGNDLVEAIKANYRGKRVLMFADCCYSGGLGLACNRLQRAGFQPAYLTSADNANTSTGNWTFTQTLIDGLKGDTFADANNDGVVTLGELAADVKAAMNAMERQPHGFRSFGLPPALKLSAVTKKPPAAADGAKFTPGTYVVAADGDTVAAGRVVAAEKEKLTVQFYDYTEKRRVTLPPAKTAALPAAWATDKRMYAELAADGQFKFGRATIEVEWNGDWWPATVVKRDGAKTRIHYVGFPSSDDEWVTRERIRPIK